MASVAAEGDAALYSYLSVGLLFLQLGREAVDDGQGEGVRVAVVDGRHLAPVQFDVSEVLPRDQRYGGERL